MSLDVYLIAEDYSVLKGSGIFVRENGSTREISIEEWNEKFPNTEPVSMNYEVGERTNEVYHGNITHNLAPLARAVGIYKLLWRPEDLGITKARQLIVPLAEGLQKLVDRKNELQQYNPPNGWGTYQGLVNFVADYLDACEDYPQAELRVSR